MAERGPLAQGWEAKEKAPRSLTHMHTHKSHVESHAQSHAQIQSQLQSHKFTHRFTRVKTHSYNSLT